MARLRGQAGSTGGSARLYRDYTERFNETRARQNNRIPASGPPSTHLLTATNIIWNHTPYLLWSPRWLFNGDGDPLDICVVSERPINPPEVILNARVVGSLPMNDQGEADDKIAA